MRPRTASHDFFAKNKTTEFRRKYGLPYGPRRTEMSSGQRPKINGTVENRFELNKMNIGNQC